MALARVKITMKSGDCAKTDEHSDSYAPFHEDGVRGMAVPGSVIELDPIDGWPGWYKDRSRLNYSYHEDWVEFWLPINRIEPKPEGYQYKFPMGWMEGGDIGGMLLINESADKYRRPVTIDDAIATKPEASIVEEATEEKPCGLVDICGAPTKISCEDQGERVAYIGRACNALECRFLVKYKITKVEGK